MPTNRELLEVEPQKKNSKLLISTKSGKKSRASKPLIHKPQVNTQDLRSRLTTFLPELKAANESLPTDHSTLNIETLDNEDQYIEMDLGLGVLEEIGDDSDDSSASGTEDGSTDIMGKLMKRSKADKPGIAVVESPAKSGLLCDESLKQYRSLCDPDSRFEMDIVISLMSRILVQLRNKRATKDVSTITKINVLREDMYKLMARRDRLVSERPIKPVHESLYFEELDRLLLQ